MIDLKGKSQVEIEKMFSNESVMETLAINTEMFYNQVADEDISYIREILKIDDIDEFMLYLIALIGNPEFGQRKFDDGEYRIIPAEALAKAIGGSRHLELAFVELQERYDSALEIVAYLDTVFYDIVLVQQMNDDGQMPVITSCKIGFDIDLSDAQVAELEIFKFPLIEQPIDWEEGHSGGYHLNDTKCTLNRGEAKQPQECLDVLNTLQHNCYELTENANLQDLQDYVYTKQLIKYDEVMASRITKNVTTTAGLVFDTMKDYQFMFQWKYDFRGRLYSTGYDINLQSDKYRKGVIRPCQSNFKGY